jgi:hypothetical protein
MMEVVLPGLSLINHTKEEICFCGGKREEEV